MPVRPVIPQHRFIFGANGKCEWQIPLALRVGSRSLKCNGEMSELCHRYYPCRADKKCPAESFPSCESRDKHEANVHGDGW